MSVSKWWKNVHFHAQSIPVKHCIGYQTLLCVSLLLARYVNQCCECSRWWVWVHTAVLKSAVCPGQCVRVCVCVCKFERGVELCGQMSHYTDGFVTAGSRTVRIACNGPETFSQGPNSLATPQFILKTIISP